MSSGLLSLRKLQLRALREYIAEMSPVRARRVLMHRIIRATEQAYRAEQFEEFVRMACNAPDAVPDLLRVVEEATTDAEMRCARCGQQPNGFRSRKASAMWQLLGLCQRCQDVEPNHP